MTQLQHSESNIESIESCRDDFPALHQDIHGHSIVYLDSAASAQQPLSVINAVADYHRHDHANVHRGVHTLSHRATEAYEGARDKIQAFINAASRREIIFTSGTTESVNLVAQSYCRPRVGRGGGRDLSGSRADSRARAPDVGPRQPAGAVHRVDVRRHRGGRHGGCDR